jgi:hypothetical protein
VSVHPQVSESVALISERLKNCAKTVNELHDWWVKELQREPWIFKDAVKWMVEQGLALAKNIGKTKILSLAPERPEPAPAKSKSNAPLDLDEGKKAHEAALHATRPKTWLPGTKVEKERAAARPPDPAPPPSSPAPDVRKNPGLSTNEVAVILGVTDARVSQLASCGDLPCERDGWRRWYQRSDVDALIQKRVQPRMGSRQNALKPPPAPEPAPPQRAREPLLVKVPTLLSRIDEQLRPPEARVQLGDVCVAVQLADGPQPAGALCAPAPPSSPQRGHTVATSEQEAVAWSKGVRRLTSFLYVLLRDELPAGAVERLVHEHVEKSGDNVRTFSSKPLEALAMDFATRVLGW